MAQITVDLMKEITENAEDNGALLVGTTKICVTQPVIMLGFPFIDDWFVDKPFAVAKDLAEEYKISRHVQDLTAEILKNEGYKAEYKTVLSLFGDFRPLAVDAGLGHWGRNGLVVNKEHGSGLLFAAIFTDAPLEKSPRAELEHCHGCGECVQACPADAFANGRLNYRKCFPQAIRGCHECISACKNSR